MRETLRRSLTAILVSALAIDPATACHFCGHYGGYYSPYAGGCDGRWYADESYYDGCCGGEVVVESDCCGCEGCEEGVPDAAPSYSEPPMTAPAPPAPDRTPSSVRKPMDDRDEAPAPALPPQPLPRATQPEVPVLPPRAEPAPPPAEPEDDLFAEPPMPEEEPSTDDLFGPPAEQSDEPAEEPSQPEDTDDLFGPLEDEESEAAPAEEEAEEETSEPSIDDLFGPPPAEDSTPPAEEEEPAPAEEAAEEDDLFGSSDAVLREPGGLASVSLRRWIDNTGDYSCRGRLIRVLDGKIQIEKDNGRTTTVPLARLSQSDLAFVHRQASAQRSSTLGQTVQLMPTR